VKVLLVLNGPRERYTDGAAEARLRVWSTYCAPGTELEIGFLAGQNEGGKAGTYELGTAQAPLSHAALYPDRCVEAEKEGYDAVIMHCCSDPGLYEARRRVSIPVIGPGEATFQAGAMLGSAIGITVPGDDSLAHHWQQVRDVGVLHQVIGMEAINKPLGTFSSQDPAAMTDAFVATAQKLVDRGADVICPTGLAILPIRVSAIEASERLGIPVLDPALTAVRRAEMLVAAVADTPLRLKV
jgi:Asp/Glu/hydantoin racemase